MPIPLLTVTSLVQLTLIESSGDGKRLRVRGEFGRCDMPTENKRQYGRKLMEREFRRLQEKIKRRALYGELDHPGDAQTKLTRASHIITSLELDGDVVIGEAEILETTAGQNLAAIIRAGGSVGVSSRGYGSVVTNEEGIDVVQEDFKLASYDFVDNPADTTAYPTPFYESTAQISLVEARLAEECVRQDTEARMEAESAAQMSAWLVEALRTEKTRLISNVREMLLQDPAVAGARSLVENIVTLVRPFMLAEEDQEILFAKEDEIAKLKKEKLALEQQHEALQAEADDLSEITRNLGYRLYIEQTLRADPDRDMLIELLGDLTQYGSGSQLAKALSTVQKRVAKNRRHEQVRLQKIEQQTQQEQEEKDRVIAALEEEISATRKENKKLATQLQIESETRFEPSASGVRRRLEESHPRSVKDVKKKARELRRKNREESASEGVQDRIRSRLGNGTGSSSRLEERATRRSTGVAHEVEQATGISIAGFTNLTN